MFNHFRFSGLVKNSYIRGLLPTEFVFHQMGGREGIIDTGIRTSETGYIQRRMMKAMEHEKKCCDGTIRSNDDIVEFLYNGDNFDATFLEKVSLDFVRWSNVEIEQYIYGAKEKKIREEKE